MTTTALPPTYTDSPAPQLEALKAQTEAHLRGIADSLGVGDAIDFTGWLIDLARELAGYATANAGKPT